MNADEYYSYPGEPRFDPACELCIKGQAHSDDAHKASVEQAEFKREVKRTMLRKRAENATDSRESEYWQACLREVDHPSVIHRGTSKGTYGMVYLAPTDWNAWAWMRAMMPKGT